jgi:hypothetical protein
MSAERYVRTILFQTHGNLKKKPQWQEDPGRDADYEPVQEVNEDRFQDQSYACSWVTDKERSQDTADRSASAD